MLCEDSHARRDTAVPFNLWTVKGCHGPVARMSGGGLHSSVINPPAPSLRSAALAIFMHIFPESRIYRRLLRNELRTIGEGQALTSFPDADPEAK